MDYGKVGLYLPSRPSLPLTHASCKSTLHLNPISGFALIMFFLAPREHFSLILHTS